MRRIAYGGIAVSMLQFRLERGGNGIKRCRKMKWRQRARLGLMGRKCDLTRQCDNVGRRRDGTEREKGGDDVS
jgi:hypothetical protein